MSSAWTHTYCVRAWPHFVRPDDAKRAGGTSEAPSGDEACGSVDECVRVSAVRGIAPSSFHYTTGISARISRRIGLLVSFKITVVCN